MTGELETKLTYEGQIQWISQLRSFNAGAWDWLLHEYRDGVRQLILISLRKRGLPHEWVDDIEQETWLTAVRKIADFEWESEEKFYRWLRAISLNHIHDYQRASERYDFIDDLRDRETNNELENFRAAWVEASDSVEDRVILQEQLSALDRAMRTLKPQEREILVCWLMGYAPHELAHTYQRKARSISMLLLRAKKKIEANLRFHSSEEHDDE